MRQRRLAVLLIGALVASACGGDDDSAAPEVTTSTTTTTEALTTTTVEVETTTIDVVFEGEIELTVENSDRCEIIGNECLLPFPSDALTAADDTAVNGLRVNLNSASLPVNASGASVDVSRQNRNDGFSPGSAALALLPGVDPAASALPPITDIARSLDAASGSVIIDATDAQRWPHWAELDANATDPERQGLFLRPAVNYPDGHRIVIGLRNLVDVDGESIEPTDVFRAYRDRLESDVEAVEARRPAMERVFADLEAAGVARDELVLAWEFTVISTESLTGPLEHMRDDAFRALGTVAPEFVVDSVERSSDDTYRIIEGTYEVPLYLEGDGSTGNGLNLGEDPDLPEVNGTWSSVFRCMIHDNTGSDDPGVGVIYGHGLLGDRGQVTSSGPRLLAERHNYVVCGTDLIGMAEEDVENAISVLTDLSGFHTLSERLMQGHLNTLFLGRLMSHPAGFVTDGAFRDDDGAALLSTQLMGYYGISQGGIMGPASTAVSFDWDRAVFGVPAVNYSTLLNRSIDFDLYQALLDPAYPDKLDQAVLLLIIQMLWDRGEGNGYINHFSDPLVGMRDKVGLLHAALGDHQVANAAMEVMARSMGASVVWPAVADGRSSDVEPFWGIDHITEFPHTGSAAVMWDSGSPLAPTENLPPVEGRDPHEDPRRSVDAVDQIDHFLRTGTVIDVCGGDPCEAAPRS